MSPFYSNYAESGGGGMRNTKEGVLIRDSIVANNADNSGNATDVFVTPPGEIDSEGNNLIGSTNSEDFTGTGDLINGTPGRIVTSVADTFHSSPSLNALSLREAIDWANNDAGSDEIWLPGWVITLTIARNTDPSPFDTDVWRGDLDIHQSLTVRGVSEQKSSVDWRPDVVDRIFELVGDYNGDGIANGSVGSEDYTIWQDKLGSTTDLRADGNDNGIVDSGDHTEWVNHFSNTYTRVGVSV